MEEGLSKALASEVSRYAAAYLDRRQALARFPWQNKDFLTGWFEASQYDRSLQALGLGDLQKSSRKLRGKTAETIIAEILDYLEVHDATTQRRLLERMAFSVLGWMSQFRYVEWQASLGYKIDTLPKAADLLAVRLVYEFVAFELIKSSSSHLIDEWRSSLLESAEKDASASTSMPLEIVWQAAFEDSYQHRVARSLNLVPAAQTHVNAATEAQLAFCIDVRSEMIRRHIEAADPKLSTIGFAGFFGVAIDYKKIDEHEEGHRCPVLLTPALRVDESAKGKSSAAIEDKITNKYTLSYFKALRKAPLAAFAYVEMLGILALRPMLTKTLKAASNRKSENKVPGRFASNRYAPDLGSCSLPKGETISAADRSARAAGILKHMGLRGGFAPVIVIAGHGSHTTNNAFGSSLDCGACGGHAGDINARVVVDLLNDCDVRIGMRSHGIDVPDSTRFVAAVHETVTDDVYLLDEESMTGTHKQICDRLKTSLRAAAETARVERQTARSMFRADAPATRAQNWSEVRPEWGLAGNAAFIVAPRSRTKNVNLSSRSFLHDYDYKKDEGFSTLELIMTAPMVVTNWINLQYFASTVAPQIYGSGNKVLHNVVNECGVIEGNGGDLRVGLPIQSVHDGSRFVHEPLRLSVFIEAPRDAMEAIITKHQVVRDLVDNEWLYLLQINSEDGSVSIRRPGGSYEQVS